MSPRVVDSKIHNYDLRRNAYELFHGGNVRDDEDNGGNGDSGGNGLYVINTLFNTVTLLRNPKISFFFRDIVKMAQEEISLVRRGIRNVLAGFKDSSELTARHEDEPLVIPSWALRSDHPE